MVFLKFCNRVKKIFDTFTDNGFLKNVFYYNMGVEFSEIGPKTISIIGLILFNMKIIDYDVSKRIPPINESDIYNKIIISDKVSENNHRFIDFIIIHLHNIFKFRGVGWFIPGHDKYQNAITWSDSYNSGKTIMDLLIKEQIEMKSRNWTTIHYIIESYDDLNIIINTCGIDGNFKNELLNVWNNLPGNQKA